MDVPRCDLPRPNVTIARANASGQAYRLTEPGCPPYDGTAESVMAILRWHDVERGGRWKPLPATTYCNVYATDVAHACGVYLPRVWWAQAAIKSFQNGTPVSAVYAKTVVELSANMLYRWLAGPFSVDFGWRLVTLTEGQDAANQGRPVVICARKVVEAHSGHISVLAPETDTVRAVRDAAGNVRLPAQSQAGGRNELHAVARNWWGGADMAEWGVWVNDAAVSASADANADLPTPTLLANAPEEGWHPVSPESDPDFMASLLDSLSDPNVA